MSWHSTVRSPQRHQRGTASEQATQQEIQHHAENEKFQEMFQTGLHQREVARYDDQQIGLASILRTGRVLKSKRHGENTTFQPLSKHGDFNRLFYTQKAVDF
jgi:hypothetical protein